ncbi:glycerol-3-phosphate dehydrogenase [Curvivirga sp.]|uniref:glycerol-3-phosphate dehydrogenase n=1 Tax=Curvivirga sp. TaxID=2856848 RepID=UPI003B5987A1
MSQQTDQIFDLFIVGGGINGVGIARDAIGRGFSVYLAEKDDLASGTSSGSTKLIHGGLRYLEHYEFNLVRKALMEREVLWKMAPHIVHPLRFVLPHHKGLRPTWLLRLGLFLYDYIGGRKLLPATKKLNLKTHAAGQPIKDDFTTGFEYSDCWVDDARLVVLNAVDARERGAVIETRQQVVKTNKVDGIWEVDVKDVLTGDVKTIKSKLVVNATGPWVDHFLNATGKGSNIQNVRLVQGSHVIVKKLYDHDRCYIFQNEDGRIIFAIPYENDFTMIGTTDHDFTGNPDDAGITREEAEYICKSASEYFKKEITADEAVWEFSGVRPLYNDGASKAQEATRDYVLRLDGEEGEAKMLNIFGGKITTYRRLAEAAMEEIETVLGTKKPEWTMGATLPGGDFAHNGREDLAARIKSAHNYLPDEMITRWVRSYGTYAFNILKNVSSLADMGEHFGGTLYAAEVDYLMKEEFAVTAEDVLYRRSKQGLIFNSDAEEKLASYMIAKRS